MIRTLLAQHDLDDEVAFGRDGRRTARELRADAAAVARELPAPDEASQVLLVFDADRYAFAAALLGAWSAGHAVALPPNQRRETVGALRERDDVVALLHDTDAGAGLRVPDALGRVASAPEAPLELPDRRYVATVFTSGTTGAAQPCPKTADQLLDETDTLGHLFTDVVGARILASVAPAHIYGLLFSVLLPLGTGGSMSRDTPRYAASIADRARSFAPGVLVTVPPHLRALAKVEPGDLASLHRLFASTAPLAEATARTVRDHLGLEVTEILGSTETGGIAWRQRRRDARWHPLPGVHVDVDEEGHLLVDSPFLAPAHPRPHVSADRATLQDDGSFEHGGRDDGVVKVGGRRVSLPAMEEALVELEEVRDAAVISAPGGEGRAQQVLAAVVSATTTPESIRRALVDRFEPSTLPRRVRIVDALPREEAGKLPRASVLRLFGLDAEGRPLAERPSWGEGRTWREEGTDHHARAVELPDNYAWFEGHFPSYPILAGAVQLHELVLPAVRADGPRLGRLTRASRLKFHHRIAPGDAIELRLSWPADAAHVDFELRRAGTSCSGGRLHFEPAPEEGTST